MSMYEFDKDNLQLVGNGSVEKDAQLPGALPEFVEHEPGAVAPAGHEFGSILPELLLAEDLAVPKPDDQCRIDRLKLTREGVRNEYFRMFRDFPVPAILRWENEKPFTTLA